MRGDLLKDGGFGRISPPSSHNWRLCQRQGNRLYLLTPGVTNVGDSFSNAADIQVSKTTLKDARIIIAGMNPQDQDVALALIGRYQRTLKSLMVIKNNPIPESIKPPNGYVLLDKEVAGDYLFKIGDQIKLKNDRTWAATPWTTIGGWQGYSANRLIKSGDAKEIIVAVKGIPKPRFKTDKPYPFGY